MKIACITTSKIPSSTANSIQVMKVCQALQQVGQQVHLWVPKFQTAEWPELANLYGLSTAFEVDWINFYKGAKQYDFSWKAVQAGMAWGAGVVYTWALQAAVIGLLRKIPTVMEFHDVPTGKLGPHLFRTFLKAPGKKVVMTTTRALANNLEEKFNITIPEQILQIAPNGTELERYEHLPSPVQARQKLNLKEQFTIVYSGHFYSGRGMEILVSLAKALPQFQFLWIGGKAEDIEPWKEKLAKHAIRNVVITGFIENQSLPLYQSAGDILVMPYQRAISGSSGGNIVKVINPMKMFDYLASGRPIAASDIPVFHEVLNEKNAVFCTPDDEQDWVRAILHLANDLRLQKRLAAQAKQDASLYTWKSRAQRTLKILEQQGK